MNNAAPAYVASPRTGTGPRVLLLHTWWGLNQPIKDLADRLARDGFTVFGARSLRREDPDDDRGGRCARPADGRAVRPHPRRRLERARHVARASGRAR